MSPSPTNPVSRYQTLLSSIAAGALVGAGVNIVRAVLLLQLERTVGGVGASFLPWRIAEEFSAELPIAVTLGIAAGLWVWAWTRRFRGSWLLALAGAIAALWIIIVGGPWTAAYHRLDLLLTQQLAERILGLEAVFGGGILLTWLIHTDSKRSFPGRVGRALALAFSLLVLLALPDSFGTVVAGESPLITAREICREVIVDADSWEVVYHHPSQEPSLGTVSPSDLYTEDGGDRPTLVMPPPCELRFPITEEDGEVHFRFVAGVDKREHWLKRIIDDPTVVLFEVERNGEPIFEADVVLKHTGGPPPLRWLRPDHSEKLVLSPGDEITLRTSLVGLSREEAAEQQPMVLGFGELALERVHQRERRKATPDAPSIVLIVQDTMRADRCSVYDYDKETTPALAELASRGIAYTRAHSTASWTWPATASLLTGLLPDAHGVTNDDSCYLVGRNQTLAEVLQRRGYTTAAFACNPLITRQKNFSQGFEYFQQTDILFIKTPQLIDQVKSWLRTHAGLRFFLYLHLVDPHAPYKPSAEALAEHALPVPDRFPNQKVLHEYETFLIQGKGVDENGKPWRRMFPEGHIEYLSSLYDASIATGDKCLGELVEALRKMGLEDTTLVVFTSDHGESWMEHGQLTHGKSVHRQQMEVPLVMAGPGLPRGVRCDTPVSNRHLATTLANVGGTELSKVRDALDLSSPESLPELPVYYGTMHGSWNLRPGRQRIYGVRDGRWVLHFAPEGSDYGVPRAEAPVGGQVRLYDIVADPGEQTDVAADHPEVAERLRQMIMDSLADQVAQQGTEGRIGAGPATMRMLEAIGYTAGKIEEE